MKNGIYLIWHANAKYDLRLNTALMHGDTHRQAAEGFAHDVLGPELEDGYRIIALGPFDQDKMKTEIGERKGKSELQDFLFEALASVRPIEFRLSQKWQEA